MFKEVWETVRKLICMWYVYSAGECLQWVQRGRLSVCLKCLDMRKDNELDRGGSGKVFVYGKWELYSSFVQYSEMTREFLLWNELDCHRQRGAHQELPTVNTHFINTKSPRSPCQGQYKVDGNCSEAAHEMESGYLGVVSQRKPASLYTNLGSFIKSADCWGA